MEEEDLSDWELLHGSDTESIDSITSDEKSRTSSVIDDGMILSDHVSVDNLLNRSVEITDRSQYGVLESGESFRIDYGSDPSNSEVVRVDLDVYRSGDGEVRVSDFEAVEEKHIESEAVAVLSGGSLSQFEDASKCFSESDDLEEVDNGRHVESQSGIEETIKDLSKLCSDSEGNELVSGDSRIVSDSGVVSTVEVGALRCGDESNCRETVWWKMPFVLLKYSAFKIGPVWSVSMAAAVMGLVLLGRRRLYDTKKKAQWFNLKVTVDDKKVSRAMNQVARHSELFTEVRRVPVIRPGVPVIRPALESPSAWPVLSLR